MAYLLDLRTTRVPYDLLCREHIFPNPSLVKLIKPERWAESFSSDAERYDRAASNGCGRSVVRKFVPVHVNILIEGP